MTVAKAVARGMLAACLISSSAQGGSMLVLGVASNDGPPSGFGSFPTTGSSPSAAPTPEQALTLGVYAPVFAPSPSPSPSYQPPAPASVASSPMSFASTAPSPSTSSYDAFVNMGTGPYNNSGSLTTGSPQPWYLGSGVDRLFGGIPNSQQQAAFESTVMQRVQQSFSLSGVPVSLTDNPNDQAAHMLSVVSQTSNPSMNNALGMTYLGGNGFSTSTPPRSRPSPWTSSNGSWPTTWPTS